MLFQLSFFYALGATAVLTSASAGHDNYPRSRMGSSGSKLRRQTAGTVPVPLAELEILQAEYTTFNGWMTSYLSSPGNVSIAMMNQTVEAYDGWMTAWVNATMALAQPSTSSAPQSSAPASSMPQPAAATPYANTSSATAAAPTGSQNSSMASSKGSFNAQATNNLAVYYGQSPNTSQVALAEICQDSNVDIVVIAFLSSLVSDGGYPKVDFGAACGSDQTPAQTAAGATGLLSCPELAANITTCQGLGKKVLLSIGGADGDTALSSDSQAQTFATTVWNIFGGGGTSGNMTGLRPFGNVTIDGFDVDNENHKTDYWSTFITTLRSTMNQDKSKQYYISSAPQCPIPDASIPLVNGMQIMDFVFVQFYNNGPCNVGQQGFLDSFKAWSAQLSNNGTGPAGPRLFVGAPASTASAGSGYLDAAGLDTAIKGAMGAGVKNMGGIMLWDGSTAKVNVVGGQDYLQVAKAALGG